MKIESGSEVSASCSASSSPSVTAAARATRTIGDGLGLACLIASLLLMSTGVRTVKAEDDALMSVDPQRVEAERQKGLAKTVSESNKAAAKANGMADTVANTTAKPAGEPRRKAPAVRHDQGPGVPGVEVQPGVVVLNTRGFNYGPQPAAIDPAAMRVEKGPQPTR